MDLYEQIVRDEGGNQLKPYVDAAGKTRIGVGRNLTDDGISASEGFLMFQNDVSNCKISVSTRLPWTDTLDDARYAVFINMCFNMGIGRLMGFEKMLAAAHVGNWAEAHDDLLDCEHVSLLGIDRAKRLAKQLLTGGWV